MMKKLSPFLLLLSISVVLIACTVGPDYKRPPVKVPHHWKTTLSKKMGCSPVDNDCWWRAFRDPVLDHLIKMTLLNNLDIKIAAANIMSARESMTIVGGRIKPNVGFQGEYARAHNNNNTEFLKPSFIPDLNNINYYWSYYGLVSDWGFDFFGGNQRKREAAIANLQSNVSGKAVTQLVVMSDVATNYILLRGAQQKLRLAKSSLLEQKKIIHLLESQYRVGRINYDQVLSSQEILHDLETKEVELSTLVINYQNAIKTLLGQGVGSLHSELAMPKKVPIFRGKINAGMPADLLRRRPDIIQSEQNMIMNNANIGRAVAEMFPKVDLSLWFTENTFSPILQRVQTFTKGTSFQVIPGISFPIFNAGRLQAQVRQQRHEFQASVLQYQKTILIALAEVEDNFLQVNRDHSILNSRSKEWQAQRTRLYLMQSQYRAGRINYIAVLKLREEVDKTHERLIDSQAKAALSIIRLYKSLGGCWQV